MPPRLDPDHAAKVMRAKGLEPLVKYPGRNNAPWPCLCLVCGAPASPTYSNVQQGQGGCPDCANNARSAKQRLDSDDAEQFMRNRGFKPLDPYPGAGKKWKCECMKCHNTVWPKYDKVRGRGDGCPICSGVEVDMAEVDRRMSAARLKPLDPFETVRGPWRCECLRCHKTVTPRYNDIKGGQGGCKYCAANAIEEADAIAVMRSKGLEPKEKYPGARKQWLSECMVCGAECRPWFTSIQSSSQGGCSACAKYGFDPALPASLYLMRHDSHRAWQVGISNRPEKRVALHKRHGWELVELVHFEDGLDAARVERAILGAWRTDGAADAVAKEYMPQGGYTETASWAQVPEMSLAPFLPAGVEVSRDAG